MSIKKLVLVVGLLGGMNSELLAVKSKHEARIQQIDTEVQILEQQIEAIENNDTLDNNDVQDAIILSNLKRLVSLWQEALTYLEDKDYFLKHSIENLIGITRDLIEIFE
jgi:outer membrane murein-binding lipoprotein Lpp